MMVVETEKPNRLIDYIAAYLAEEAKNKADRYNLTIRISRAVYEDFYDACRKQGLITGQSKGNLVLEAFMSWFAEKFRDKPRVVQLTLPLQAQPAKQPENKSKQQSQPSEPKPVDYTNLSDSELIELYRKLKERTDVVQVQLIAFELKKRGIDRRKVVNYVSSA
jgi:hypothetical protein